MNKTATTTTTKTTTTTAKSANGETIRGKSFFKGEVTTDIISIQKNKNTILHTICHPHEGIPPPKPASNTNSPKNRSSFSSFINWV